MFKFFLLSIIVCTSNSFASSSFKTFSQNQIINKIDINYNYQFLNEYLEKFQLDPNFQTITQSNITSSDFNHNTSALNASIQVSNPLITYSSPLTSTIVNEHFSNMISSINDKVSFSDCNKVIVKSTGIKLLDSDGVLGLNEPSHQYCNYLYGAANLNKFRIRAYSSGFDYGSLNYLKLNETDVFYTGGRGWRLTILNEKLETVFSENYDTYAYPSETTRLINQLNNTITRSGLIVFTTSDEPNLNGSSNPTLRTAIQNYAGCDAGIISTVAHRQAYVCVSQIKPGSKIVLYQSRLGTYGGSDLYIDYNTFKSNVSN